MPAAASRCSSGDEAEQSGKHAAVYGAAEHGQLSYGRAELFEQGRDLLGTCLHKRLPSRKNAEFV